MATFSAREVFRRWARLAVMAAAVAVLPSTIACDKKTTDDGNGDPGSTTTRFVTATGAGSMNGGSWANAYASLQAALADAAGDANIVEIWVAAGTYLPTSGTDRAATFQMLANVTIYGGFDGTETVVADRDVDANPTILSGDIGTANDPADNVYHVVTGATGGIIDGFIIEKGYAVLGTGESLTSADDAPISTSMPNAEILRIVKGVKKIAGGGMLNVQCAPTIRNCTFRANTASKGGAAYNMVADQFPELDTHAAPRFESCVFENNMGEARGGAVNNDFKTNATFIDVEFRTNTCDDKGGGIYNDFGCNITVVNGLFVGNSAERGGAMVNDGSSSPLLAYCTFAENTANDIGGSLYQGTYGAMGATSQTSTANHPQLVNCISVGNSSGNSSSSISNWHDDSLVVSNSDIEDPDGTLTQANFLNGDYSPINTAKGWMAGRGLDENDIAPLTHPTYPGFTYTTTSTPGPGVVRVGIGWPSPDFTTLAAALAAAQGGEELWVCAGTYKPTTGTDRTAAFVIPDGVSVYGGFDGAETQRTDRSPAINVTILSGDIGTANDASDNSYHVVVAGGNTVLDGFTVERGNADGDWHHSRGGGLIAYLGVSFTIANCTFGGNSAINGGALCAYKNAVPTISDSTFSNNSAVIGGAMLLRDGADAVVTNVTFGSNTASDRGGAVYADYGASPSFTDCTFFANTATGAGGGFYADDNASQIGQTDSTFSGGTFQNNTTQARGGGAMIYNKNCTATFSNVTFISNAAETGGGAAAVDFQATGTFTGCTFNSNTSTTGNADTDANGGTIN